MHLCMPEAYVILEKNMRVITRSVANYSTGDMACCGTASAQRATATADHGPLTEGGSTRCGWGRLSWSLAGLQARWIRTRYSPFPALKRACALVGVLCPIIPRRRNPHGPRAGAVPRAGQPDGTCWRCGNF